NRTLQRIMVEQIYPQVIDVILPWTDNMYENKDDNDLHEFLEQFGVHVMYLPFTESNFEIFRQRVLNYDQYQRATKKQRELRRKEQMALSLPYKNHWNKYETIY
ncbi:unnamed protein product, partial [Rotaria sp. Silwood2]